MIAYDILSDIHERHEHGFNQCTRLKSNTTIYHYFYGTRRATIEPFVKSLIEHLSTSNS